MIKETQATIQALAAVESFTNDIDALFASLTEKRAILSGFLEACGAASVAAVQAMAVLHREAAATANNRKMVYESLLLDKTFEQWMEDIGAIENLPGTRETAVIDEEIGTNRTRLEEGIAAARKHADAIADWKQKYTDHDTIGQTLLEARAAFKQARDRLASLPGLPEHFGSVQEFLDTLAAAQQPCSPGSRARLRRLHSMASCRQACIVTGCSCQRSGFRTAPAGRSRWRFGWRWRRRISTVARGSSCSMIRS